MQRSGPEHFLTAHSSFEDPEYILRENVTLYCLTETDAIFVQVEEHIDVTSSDQCAFAREVQFRKARKLIALPIHTFHKIAESIGTPQGKLVFITHTSRCGSTLLTQVFEHTGYTLAWSEPDTLSSLANLSGTINKEELNLLTQSTINVLCKPVSRDIQAYVFKLVPPAMSLLPCLKDLYPKASHLFMYGCGLKVAISCERTTKVQPILRLFYILAEKWPNVSKIVFRNMGSLPKELSGKMAPITIGILYWAWSMKRYEDFWQKGIPISAVRYEDLIENPQRACQSIFEHCGLPFEPKAVERAFSCDSQRHSAFSRAKLNKYKWEELTDEAKVQTDRVCDYFKLPRIPDIYVTPGTITDQAG